MFKNRMSRRIYGPVRERETGGWKKLNIEGIHNLYSSPNVIGAIKPTRIRWVRYGRGKKCVQNFSWKS
jgi:hypothetical protein